MLIWKKLVTISAACCVAVVAHPSAAKSSDQQSRLLDAEKSIRLEISQIYADYGIKSMPIHRGGGMHQPENTIEAFQYSWDLQMVPEADIRTTKDGVIVAIHDNDVTRTAPSAPKAIRAKTIDELTLAELKTLDFGTFRGFPGQKIPTLDEVFAVMAQKPSRFLHLDYKDTDLDQLAALVKKHHVEKQVIFTTNRYDLIQTWRVLFPKSQTMIWMGGTQSDIQAKLDQLRAVDFRGIYIVHLHYQPIAGSSYNMDDQFMLNLQNELQDKGVVLQIMPWNIEDPVIFERLYSIGIKNLGTDYPDLVKAVRASTQE